MDVCEWGLGLHFFSLSDLLLDPSWPDCRESQKARGPISVVHASQLSGVHSRAGSGGMDLNGHPDYHSASHTQALNKNALNG